MIHKTFDFAKKNFKKEKSRWKTYKKDTKKKGNHEKTLKKDFFWMCKNSKF